MKPAVFVIGLQRATGRAELIKNELMKAGLNAQRINAVDCQKHSRDDLLQFCKPQGPWGYFHTKDMACTLSHASAWEALVSSDANAALILEDDVFISPELGEWMSDLSWLPEDAGLVRFEHWRSPRLRVALERSSKRHLGRDLREMRSRNPGGAAYVITRQCARHFLDQAPFDLTLDALLFNPSASSAARKVKIYQVVPAMVVQGNEADGEAQMGPPRGRPEGWRYYHQKVMRAKCEIYSGVGVIRDVMFRRANLERLSFQANVCDQ